MTTQSIWSYHLSISFPSSFIPSESLSDRVHTSNAVLAPRMKVDAIREPRHGDYTSVAHTPGGWASGCHHWKHNEGKVCAAKVSAGCISENEL